MGRQEQRLVAGLGLLVAFGGPVAIAAAASQASSDLGIQVVLQALFCSLALIIVAIVLRLERLPLRSIGLRKPTWSTLATAALLFAVGLVAEPLVIGPLVRAWGQEGVEAGIAELAVMPMWFRFVVGATGGIVEETLYRGYAVERLITLTGSRWWGATIAVLVFAVSHIPAWGVGYALTADLIATAFYLWRRDLIANMMAHSAGIIVAMFTLVPPSPG